MNDIDLKNYTELRLLGKGGFGRVFKVRNINDNRFYAVKQCITSDDLEIRAISREINILSKINHPAIIRFIGFSPLGFDGNPSPTFILEFAKNGSLNTILDNEKKGMAPRIWDDTQKYINIFGIANGMSFLHKKHTIHRDLKPDNILEDENFYPKIGDLGLSKIFDPIKPSDQSMFGGTNIYMAPEMFIGDHYDISIDVYAFSIILFEIVTGEKPYKEIKNKSSISYKVVHNYRPKFSEIIPISDEMKSLIEQCWSQKPSDRPTFEEIVERLTDDNFIENSGYNVDLDRFQEYIEYLETEEKSFHHDKSNIIKTELSSIKTIKSSRRKSSVRRDYDFDTPKVATITRGKRSSSVFNRKTKDKKAQTCIQAVKLPQQNNRYRPNEYMYNRSNVATIKIYPRTEYLNLPKGLQQKVLEAENGNNDSLIEVIMNLIEGKKFFHKNIELAVKYLQYGVEKQIVECMEIYGEMLLKGSLIPDNELNGVEILTNAAEKFNSNKSKLLLAKHFISKENTDENNYFQAKKYAKDVACTGNIEAIVLYGKLCEKTVENKYGKIEQNFYEAFKYFELAAKRDDPEGLAYYSYYLQYPNGLFTPNIKESIKYLKKSKNYGNAWAMTRYGILKLYGIEVKQDINKGMELIKKAVEKKDPYAYYIYGFCLLYGHILDQNEEEGLSYIQMAAFNGNNSAIIEYIRNNKRYPNVIDVDKLRNKLIQNGRSFFYKDKDIFEDLDFNSKVFDQAILKKGIDMNCTFCMIDYAKILLEQEKLDEAKKFYKKAADFGDKEAIKEYVNAMKERKFGIINTIELQNYNEILKAYKKNKIEKNLSEKKSIFKFLDLFI